MITKSSSKRRQIMEMLMKSSMERRVEQTLILSVQLTKSVYTVEPKGIQGYILAKESAKDKIIATVMRYTQEGWPFGNQWNEMNS